jgi:deoxyribodipyrimidine photo-lyase
VIKINIKRVRLIKDGKGVKGKQPPVLYWMNRDQRVQDNWALVYAQEMALTKNQPLVVLFCLLSSFMDSLFRAYKFMIQGLKEVQSQLESLKIPFIVEVGNPDMIIPKFIEKYNVSTLITDFSSLRIKREWINGISEKIDCSFYEVDAHNIIPVWEASQKKEYAAYTLRKKIQQKLKEFLEDFPKIKIHPYNWKENVEKYDLSNYSTDLNYAESNYKIKAFKPGESNAKEVLDEFLQQGLKKYTQRRNDPNVEGTSDLSPYLHFGQISSQRVVLEAQKVKPISQLKNSFYDEIIVRKELSDNFCYYELNYDTFEGFHSWAQETLNEHREDKREYLYTKKDFEEATTHDDAWNAAQLQMVTTGKMHGYMRMYWGKKILEWTESPEDALKIAIYLNDKYELDGRDPNGYSGIAWSIGGIHDRAWNERKIYGKIRYMSYNGLKRKFDLKKYINSYINKG